VSAPKVTPPFGYHRRGRSGPYEEDRLEQLVLRVTRETVAAGGDLRAVAERLVAAVCFECGAPAETKVVVVPGGSRTVPLCGKCGHWRQPLAPGETDIEAIGAIRRAADANFDALMMVALEQYRRNAAAEKGQPWPGEAL
jgi:hypothetical protein